MASEVALSRLRVSVALLPYLLKMWLHVVNAAQGYTKWKNSLVILIYFMYLNRYLLGTAMADASVLLVQKSQHLYSHPLGSQNYDPEGGQGRKFPRIMGAFVLFVRPCLSPDLLLFLLWVRGLTWQWDQACTRGGSVGVSCTQVPVQAHIPWVLCSAWWVPLFHQANSDGPVLPSWAAGMWLVCHGRHCRCEHTPCTSSSSALQTSTWYVPWGQMYVVPKPIHHIHRGKSL